MPPARPVCAGELAKRGNSPAQQDGTRQRNSAPCPVLIRPSGFLIHSRTSLSDLIATELNHPITVSSATPAGSFLANRTKPLTYCVVAIVARHAAARCCVASLRRDVAPLFLTRKWVFQPQIGQEMAFSLPRWKFEFARDASCGCSQAKIAIASSG